MTKPSTRFASILLSFAENNGQVALVQEMRKRFFELFDQLDSLTRYKDKYNAIFDDAEEFAKLNKANLDKMAHEEEIEKARAAAKEELELTKTTRSKEKELRKNIKSGLALHGPRQDPKTTALVTSNNPNRKDDPHKRM